jgi:phosphoribosylformimino-5-aminoimidazole carboxamide ribotide isomerase
LLLAAAPATIWRSSVLAAGVDVACSRIREHSDHFKRSPLNSHEFGYKPALQLLSQPLESLQSFVLENRLRGFAFRVNQVLILPAIDIRGGQCVRLRQGDYDQETVFGDDPAAVARRWVEQGATFLHLVDLDGARSGHPVNQESIRRIVTSSGVPCQLGGGLRTEADIAETLSWRVDRVVVGTKALQDPAWLQAVCQRFPGRIVLGIDAKNGRVAVDGWTAVTDRPALDLARQFATWPLAALVYTDISRDGMMAGPNLDALGEVTKAVSLPVIASGGVTTLDDVRRLARLNLAGCIIGRALYEGRLQLTEAISCVSRPQFQAPRQ